MNVLQNVGIGSAINRVDGLQKVTGRARYAAEHPVPGLLHGVIVSGAIPKGRIVTLEDSEARAVPGVVEVLSHKNRPHVAWFDRSHKDMVAPPGSPFKALYDDKILFSGQPIALVIAESFEVARYAASLVRASYEVEPHNTDFHKAQAERFMPSKKRDTYHPPKNRGDADAAFAAAPVKVSAEYHLATEHHNPMEMHASTVVWEGDGSLTVFDKTQGPQNVRDYLAGVFGMSASTIRVMNPFVGGAFGSGLRPQYQVYLAVMAARMLQRSVRVVMTRQQMFTHGHRPEALQSVQLGAERDGTMTAIRNSATTSTSRYENNMEDVVIWGMMNYACENAAGEYAIAPVDTATSTDMRAPGAATGMTFFEMAVDELAYAAGIDPLEFRLKNYSETDQMNGTPFTSKALREAYAEGAEAFGWSRRSQAPRSMKEGRELVGWGVATGMWDAMFSKTSASARLSANGHLEVASAASDIGTGTYTVMTQAAADTLGLPVEQIAVRLGDSSLPKAPVEGGSWMAASVGAAVQLACRSVAEKLLSAAAKMQNSPLAGASMEAVRFSGGRIALRDDPARGVAITEVMRASGTDVIAVEETASAGISGMISQMRKSRNTHSAIFVEVRVDEELGVVRVTRVVNAAAAGRIINPKTARSQILGGVVMGISMALHEESMTDHRYGRFMNHNYAEYHVPVNADIHDIQVIFVDEPDPEVTPLGVKGLGEIGIVGTAAAVANAIFHATGKRVRALPITIDKLVDDTVAP
ncbi:xanthine dehydrogenase family protein molybdopterin-binding subunit [Teichococcus vastitatis]|uniref:Xanthine dehydrogenase family protein molybdopterin-binding subunit n=1 Tax=Teichococcus vastitatis TaxID=2307076 RepID=A0ABS9W8H7_9PROT|nr:xanthine dehydrogenase family protein molybdopterin-binding subunit [Pseudoroseomonas vastitatis]MCI0755215.1 xanthine dehydrogenase family protein molybdopterin-binding subunit [Pseudoroseomonas vastitatis]